MNVNVIDIPQDASKYVQMGLGLATGEAASKLLIDGDNPMWDATKEQWQEINDAYWLDI
jgi:hypothetical protein